MIRWMRPITAAIAATAALAVTGCGGAVPQPAPASAPSAHATTAAVPPAPKVPAAAIAAARQVVAPNADGKSFVLVRTETLTPAEAGTSATYQESDDIAYGTHGAPAYVITFRGTFIGRGLSYPPWSGPPHGRYFSVGINGADMSVSGLSLSQDDPAPWHRP
jgi:hypothetical protein